MSIQIPFSCLPSFHRFLLATLLLTPLATLDAAEPVPAHQTLAFPGAEGHGAMAKGGRGGRVVRVTTLKKRGPGSLAWAINDVKEPRTIVFDVSGVIDCNNEIAFAITPENDHVTIAGETSPHGVAIYNYRRFDLSGEEVILRFLRFRGTRIHTKNDPDGLLIVDAKNVIYNYSNTQQTWGAEGPGLTIVNCLFKLGPDRRKNAVPVKSDARVIRGCVSREADDRSGPPVPDQGPEPKLSLERIDTAADAYTRVLQQAGAVPHDATSALMVSDTRHGTGRQGYEDRIASDRDALEKAVSVLPDSDQDGLPDEWERAHQLDSANADDASMVTQDGYTPLERYCHHLAALRIEAAIRPTPQ